MTMADGLFEKYLPSLVESGKVPMSALDDAVRQFCGQNFAPDCSTILIPTPAARRKEILTPENRAAARRMAQESMVLLKNDKHLLPLDKGIKTIALIGPLVDDQGDQLGSWAGDGQEENAVTPHEGIQAKLPHAKILVSRGVDFDLPSGHKYAQRLSARRPRLQARPAWPAKPRPEPRDIAEAVELAQQADVAVLFLGEPANYSGEASSRSTLRISGRTGEIYWKPWSRPASP